MGVSAGRIRIPSASDGQAELIAGAEHAVADDAHLLGPLDPPVARQDGPRQRHGHALTGRDVGRAAHDVERLAGPHGHARQRQPVRARMLLDRQQLPDDDLLPVRAPALDALDLHAEQRQPLRQGLGRHVDVDELAQPAQGHPHRNCSRKPQVVLHVQAQVGDAVAQVGHPLDAHPEREPLVALRVQAAVLEHDRVDHARAEDRHPAGPRAGRAADAAADEAFDVEGHRRLGERVVAGSEPGPLVRAVERPGELVEQSAQVAHRRALVDHQALDLEELRGVAGVDRLVAIAAAREEGADRGRLLRASRGSGQATCGSAAGGPRRRRRACPTGRAPGDRAGC